MAFNLICIFQFLFKRTPISLNFSLCIIKTPNVNMIYFALIKIRFNIFMCYLLSAYFLDFMQKYFINCNVNNSIIFLLSVKNFIVYGIMPVVLSRPSFIILRTKVSQDLPFV